MMKQNFKQAPKALSLLLALAMCLLMLAACAPDDVTEPTDSESRAPSDTAAPASSESTTTDTESESSTTSPDGDTYSLSEFALVRPDNASSGVIDMAIAFSESLLSYQINATLKNDFIAKGEETQVLTAKEILFGQTNRTETETAMANMPDDQDWGICFFEHKIAIVGRSEKALKLAMEAFIKNYVKKSSGGVLSEIPSTKCEWGTDPSLTAGLSPFAFSDYPMFSRVYDEAKLCSNYVCQYLYKNVTDAAVTEYIGRLEANGFTKAQENAAGSIRTATLMKEEGMITLTYQTSDSSLIVTADSYASDTYQKPAENSWQKLTDNTFCVMTLDYSKYTCAAGCDPKYDNNGLCYIIILEDGRFIVYDGGYADSNGTNDCEIIYEFLRDNNRREGKPVVAAWIFTHSHADHYGAFKSFTSKHAQDVTVERLIANTGKDSCYTGGHDGFLEKLRSYESYYKGAEFLQPHVGQKLYFCNVEIEVLYTHEMFHFNGITLNNENTASMVTRISMDGVSLLITGDSSQDAGRQMVKLYGNYLKSDFFQVNHHGNGGCWEDLYRKANPMYALWTTSQYGLKKRTAGETYPVGMPSDYDAKLNKKIFEAVGGTRESLDENGAINNWCADGPVEMMTFGENKTLSISYYNIREELLPERIPYNP